MVEWEKQNSLLSHKEMKNISTCGAILAEN